MTYAGNPSLAQETKSRILDTYSQTLDLAEQGRTQEAALGCDFILKMDPLFAPARELQGRLEGAAGGIEVSDLRPTVEADNGDAAARAIAAGPPPAPEAPAAASPAQPPPPPAAEPVVEEAAEAIPMVEVEAEPVFEELPAAGAAPEPEVEAVPELEVMPEVEPAFPSELEGAVFDAAEEVFPAAQPVSEAATDGSNRVDELLSEGQHHFEANDLQAAIDAWSRIFLIDIENQEAARRIEEARKLKDEQERQVEELFHEAVGHRDAGRIDEARESLLKVLELQPNHLAAQESLEHLESAAVPAAEAPAAPAEVPPPPPPAEDSGSQGGDEGLFDPALFDGEEGAAAPTTVTAAGKSSSGPSRRFLTIGIVVALVAAAAGWYVWDRRDELFPNAQEPAATAQQQPKRLDEIDRAVRLRADGRVEEAIAMLEELPADHPRHDVAQQHLANWREEVGPQPESEAEQPGDEPVDLARRERLLEQARAAYGRKEFLAAARAFSAADGIAPLEGPADDLFRDAKRQLLPIANQIDLFRQREWELLLPSLWRLLEREPDNRDVRQLLADSYYNLGVMDLRRSAPDRAVERFREVVKLEPDNQMSARLLDLSDAYASRPIDPLYRIFVQQLDIRR